MYADAENDPIARARTILRRAALAIGCRDVVVSDLVSIPDTYTLVSGMFMLTVGVQVERPTVLQQTTHALTRTLTDMTDTDDPGRLKLAPLYGAKSSADRFSIVVMMYHAEPNDLGASQKIVGNSERPPEPRIPRRVPCDADKPARTQRSTGKLRITMENIERAVDAVRVYLASEEGRAALVHDDETIADYEWSTIDGPTNELTVYTNGGHDGMYNGTYIIMLNDDYTIASITTTADNDCTACMTEADDDRRAYEQSITG